MKKIIIPVVVILVIVGGIIFYKNKNDNKLSPIDQLVSTYENYTFNDVKTYEDGEIFSIEKQTIDYSNTTDNITIQINNTAVTFYLVDKYLHVTYSNNDIIFNYIGKVDRLMQYRSCNCSDECYKIVILTEDGKLYYIDNNFDMSSPLTPIQSEEKFSNIGFIADLDIPSSCGVNGLAGTTTAGNTVIFDHTLNKYTQDYYTFIGNEKETLYIYPDGSIKLYLDDMIDFDIKISTVFRSNDIFYILDNKGYIYSIENKTLKKLNEEKVVKVGYRTNDTSISSIIVIYEDASAKQFNIDNGYKVVSYN